jgi:hypothetical protein
MTDAKQRRHFHHSMVHGYDFDSTIFAHRQHDDATVSAPGLHDPVMCRPRLSHAVRRW